MPSNTRWEQYKKYSNFSINPGKNSMRKKLYKKIYGSYTDIDKYLKLKNLNFKEDYNVSFRQLERNSPMTKGDHIERPSCYLHNRDWICSVCLDGNEPETNYFSTHSGKVVQVHKGKPIHVFDLGAFCCAYEIAVTKNYIYLLTFTHSYYQLYVLSKGGKIIRTINIYDKVRLIISSKGFGLLFHKILHWYKSEGVKLGEIHAKNPIRLIYSISDGMIVETRQHRAIINGIQLY